MAVDRNEPVAASSRPPYQSMADNHPAALLRVAENTPPKSAEEIVRALTSAPTAGPSAPAPTSHPNATAEELQRLDPSRNASIEDMRRLSELQAKRRASQARPQ